VPDQWRKCRDKEDGLTVTARRHYCSTADLEVALLRSPTTRIQPETTPLTPSALTSYTVRPSSGLLHTLVAEHLTNHLMQLRLRHGLSRNHRRTVLYPLASLPCNADDGRYTSHPTVHMIHMLSKRRLRSFKRTHRSSGEMSKLDMRCIS
jgi:hypothetical protein